MNTYIKWMISFLIGLSLITSWGICSIIYKDRIAKAKRMYQIDVVNDSVFLYNGKDLIGYYLATKQSMKSGMDSLILMDNQ